MYDRTACADVCCIPARASAIVAAVHFCMDESCVSVATETVKQRFLNRMFVI